VSQPAGTSPETPQVSRCQACGAASYPRKRYCPTCGSTDLAAEPIPHIAEIYSYTRIPGEAGDRWVALVNAGDVRVIAAVTPGAAGLAIGDRVGLNEGRGSSGFSATSLP
jgi:uncharacterized OB-fold protein